MIGVGRFDVRMVRRVVVPVVMLLAAAGVSTTVSGSAGAAPPDLDGRGGPGTWTKISTGTGGINYQASAYRSPDGVLHVVYPKFAGADTVQLGHVAIDPDGTVALQNNILPSDWAFIDPSPIVIGDGGGGLRVVAGGKASDTGYWSDGRMYTMTAPEAGTPWTLPTAAVGQSHEAYGSAGTAATTLEDGTPVAAFPLSSAITWHVGTGEATPDESFSVTSGSVSNLAMVRDGDAVWIGWYQNGDTPATNGTFVRQIEPTLGATMKAPQSSVGATSVPTGRVALAARTGGGVFAAYCLGFPTCDKIALWKVGAGSVVTVPSSKYAAFLAISPGPSGRIWVAWSDNIPKVQALRTNIAGTKVGPKKVIGMPSGTDSVYAVTVNGTTGRGDVVINVGNAFWHTQVAPGLTLRASPTSWKHGKARKVTFTATDAGDKVFGVKVSVASKHCTTAGNGTCKIAFPKSTKAGRLVAKATKSGYGAGSVRLKVT